MILLKKSVALIFVGIISLGNTTAQDCLESGKPTNDNEMCKATPDAEVCSARGICKCGQCDCNNRPNPSSKIYGQYCECDNFNCPYYNQQVCAGHGQCDCNLCICYKGWTGSACECSLSVEDCKAENGAICNGHGTCKCGECICEEPYSGEHCEICPTCPLSTCSEIQPCTQCHVFKSGPYSNNQELCNSSCESYRVMSVLDLPDLPTVLVCDFVDTDGCSVVFGYQIEKTRGRRNVFAEREKFDCVPTDEGTELPLMTKGGRQCFTLNLFCLMTLLVLLTNLIGILLC